MIEKDAESGQDEKENHLSNNILEKYDIRDWNYYQNFCHKINNECESYHHALNIKFNSKLTIWKFI